jgi:hypothetical protein
LANNSMPIPNAYRTTFEYILNADLIDCFQSDRINIKELERISAEMERWNLRIDDSEKVARIAGQSIFREIKRIRNEHENSKRIQRLNRLFPLLKKFEIETNLNNSQNLYFEISMENKGKIQEELHKEWYEQFNLLGDNLGVKVE